MTVLNIGLFHVDLMMKIIDVLFSIIFFLMSTPLYYHLTLLSSLTL